MAVVNKFEEIPEIPVVPVNKSKVLGLWKIAGILAIVTAIEFLFAFTIPFEYKWTKITIFIILTIVKAYYIVSEFMHLGHEKKSLVYSIILPMMFLLWLIAVLIIESGYIFGNLQSSWMQYLDK